MGRRFLATCMLLAMSVAALSAQKSAPEPKDAIHLSGTVSKINGDTVTVSVIDQSADVKLLPTTTYKVGGKPATQADLQVGDGVVVWVVRKNPDWLAQSVKITHPKK